MEKNIEKIPFINTGKTMLDAGLQEMAWHKALLNGKNEGFTHVVSVTTLPFKQLQLHYFKSLAKANEFQEMTKTKPEYWLNASAPRTIKSALKQCWS